MSACGCCYVCVYVYDRILSQIKTTLQNQQFDKKKSTLLIKIKQKKIKKQKKQSTQNDVFVYNNLGTTVKFAIDEYTEEKKLSLFTHTYATSSKIDFLKLYFFYCVFYN